MNSGEWLLSGDHLEQPCLPACAFMQPLCMAAMCKHCARRWYTRPLTSQSLWVRDDVAGSDSVGRVCGGEESTGWLLPASWETGCIVLGGKRGHSRGCLWGTLSVIPVACCGLDVSVSGLIQVWYPCVCVCEKFRHADTVCRILLGRGRTGPTFVEIIIIPLKPPFARTRLTAVTDRHSQVWTMRRNRNLPHSWWARR